MSRSRQFVIVAIVCASLAGLLAYRATAGLERREGARVTVLVAATPLKAGTSLESLDGEELVAREIPARFAPADAISDPADLAGAKLVGPLSSGGFVTSSVISGHAGTSPSFRLRAGERALSIEVRISPVGHQLAAGERVDLFASGLAGGQGTQEVLAGAEVLAVEGADDDPSPEVTLRLARGQVASVVRADVFARELRAVVAGR